MVSLKESLDSLKTNHVRLTSPGFCSLPCPVLINLDQNIISMLMKFVNITRVVRTVNILDNKIEILIFVKGQKNELKIINLKFYKDKCK